MRAFRNQFLIHYQDVLAITEPVVGYGMSGKELLEEYSPAAVQLYELVRAERLSKDSPSRKG